MLKYIAGVIVNGPDPSLGAVGAQPAPLDPTPPSLNPLVDIPQKTKPSLREIYLKVITYFVVVISGPQKNVS